MVTSPQAGPSRSGAVRPRSSRRSGRGWEAVDERLAGTAAIAEWQAAPAWDTAWTAAVYVLHRHAV